MTSPAGQSANRLAEVGLYFLTLGAIAFGGPAAHIALMRRDLVQRRRWVEDDEFVDLMGATNLIPGPNSTEMTMHLGYQRAGWWGLWLGGLGFIGPAVAIVLALAWAYVEYGDTPTGQGILLGVQAVVLAIIIQAVWGLRSAVVKGWPTLVVGAAAVVAALLDVNEVVVIFVAGFAIPAWELLKRAANWGTAAVLPFITSPPGYSPSELFLVFLKIGSVLYGSGYVLIAFLETEFVENRGWITEQQLLDAVAVGQFTPGPLFSSATFVGYLVDGWRGAAIATVAIFIPSFLFVTLSVPFLPRLRTWTWTRWFLDGVNVAAVALMAVVCFELGLDVLDSWFSALLFVVAAVVLIVRNPNSAWVVLAGAAAGVAWETLR